jgi:hypothetical protein
MTVDMGIQHLVTLRITGQRVAASAAAYGMDDLDLVIRVDDVVLEGASRDNLAVDLEGQALVGQAERTYQFAGAQVVRHLAWTAV